MATAPISVGKEAGYAARVEQEQHVLIYEIARILENELVKTINGVSFKNFAFPTRINNGNIDLFNAFYKTRALRYLNKIPPSILSALVPKIKLYKVFYNGKKIAFDWQIPFDDYIDPNDIQRILTTGRGVPRSVNIVSFDYNFVGTDNSTAESCITGKMQLKFGSIDSLLQTFELDEFGKIITTAGVKGKYKFDYADLVNQEAKFAKGSSTQSNEKYYRLKALIGYTVTEETIKGIADSGVFLDLENKERFFNGGPKDIELITDAINSTKTLLHIYPTTHEIAFEGDGTITMNVDFKGAIESLLQEYAGDVILASNAGKNHRAALEAADAAKQAAKQKYDKEIEKIDADPSNPDTDKEKKDNEKKKFDEATKAENEKINAEAVLLHQEWLKEFFDSSVDDRVMLYRATIKDGATNADLVNQLVGTSGEEQETNANELSKLLTGADYSKHKVDVKPEDNDFYNNYGELVKKVIDGNDPSKISPDMLQPVEGFNNGEYISFFMLGDFLSKIIGKCTEAFKDAGTPLTEIPKFILGNISLLIPDEVGKAIATSSPTFEANVRDTYTDLKGKKYNVLTINIAKIPISLKMFDRWFINTVVKNKKSTYPLTVFMNDIMRLIVTSLNNTYGSRTASMYQTRTVNLALTVHKDLYDELKINGKPTDFTPLLGSGAFTSEKLSTADSRNIFLVYCSGIPLINIRASNVLANEELGIFTFTIGRNVGILKDIKFKKMDIPYLKEARMTTEGSLANGLLRMKYNVDVSLFGPCVFRPGDVIVVNPVFLSFGKIAETQKVLIDQLGLGGVYVVNKCSTSVGAGKVDTNLDCVFQAYGNGEIEIGGRGKQASADLTHAGTGEPSSGGDAEKSSMPSLPAVGDVPKPP